MVRFHASWVVPIGRPPLRDAWVGVDRDVVVSYGPNALRGAIDDGAREVDLGAVAIVPGLVNAHTHLELSYLRGQVPAGPAFVDWIRALMAARRAHAAPDAPQILDAIPEAVEEAVRCGTAIVGDISNTLVTHGPLVRSPLAAVVFFELIGFKTADPEKLVAAALETVGALPATDRVRASLAAHAPYSVAPRVFQAMRRALDRDPRVYSVHLAESADEVEFIRTATGPWRTLLEDLGVWDAAWVAPGTSPVEYLDDCGFLGARLLAVHAVQTKPSDLARLAARRTTLVTCPRSNVFTRAGKPPIEAFYRSGARVAIGTDSLASAPNLNLFAELATLRALAPSVPGAVLLDSATRQGAEALGFGRSYGTIEPGKRARLLAVDVPPGTDDVEEYLVSGIEPAQLRWMES